MAAARQAREAAPHHQGQLWGRGLTLSMSEGGHGDSWAQLHLIGNTLWAQRELLLMFALVLSQVFSKVISAIRESRKAVWPERRQSAGINTLCCVVFAISLITCCPADGPMAGLWGAGDSSTVGAEAGAPRARHWVVGWMDGASRMGSGEAGPTVPSGSGHSAAA